MLNKKALIVFLSLTFGITIALVVAARLSGFSLFGAPDIYGQLTILGAMFAPAFSAIFTHSIVLKKPLKELGFTWGPWQMYAKTYGVICVMFIINYAITWALVIKPDFTLGSFMALYNIPPPLPVPVGTMLALFAAITFIGAPIFNFIPSLGEEIGWRGFLLPNLEPLGKTKAIIYSGMIWALWHTPMILILGFGYGVQAWPGVILHFLLVTGLGIYMGYVWFQTRSTLLAAFMHAVFNANAYGIWAIIFVSGNKLLVGGQGITGALLCVILGLIVVNRARRESAMAPSAPIA
jgi:uncharacterized protein